MPPGDPQLVPRGGILIGASGSAFLDQLCADIYLQDIWTSVGEVRRIGVACVGWGLSAAVIQAAEAEDPGNPGPWQIDNELRNYLVVNNPGQQMVGVPLIPQPLPNAVPPGLGAFVINGFACLAHRLPWHHRLTVTAHNDKLEPLRLHYHKHQPRKGHGPEPPPLLRPKEKGTHYVFDKIVYSTQIQNCRRAERT
ncbi:hypothetical protein C8Q79DRAFT_1012951 [Trametes meyenii]|nr:hypothetical protein C8Q79DRAFT_1012951 [Trametes meyenii]